MTPLWNTTPRSIEELAASLEAIEFYETLYSEQIPIDESIVLTNAVMLDIVGRIIRLEGRND